MTRNLNEKIDSPSPQPGVIESIEPESIGENLGFEIGDKLITINGIAPRDIIDYRYLISEEEITLEVKDKKDKIHIINFEKDADEGLGISFTEALFDGILQCNNNCPFCFIDQQPPGKRKSLYIKDDDYRLSFLYGSYLTLTNLQSKDWNRINQQRLSPLFISVHATEPELRAKLLKNPKAGLLMEQIQWFAEHGLQIHAQVVVCPTINDGNALEQTISDLAIYAKGNWPTVLSAAIVPVGLTRFRPAKDRLIPVNKKCARKVIKQVEKLQHELLNSIGSRFAWLADEWYLIADKPLPSRSSYEDLPQQENGVGSIRAFLEEITTATKHLPEEIETPRKCSWVVGRLVENALKPVSSKLNRVKGLSLYLYGLPSEYWGQDQVVTGLLTGEDLLKGLKGLDLGEELLVPSVMLRNDQEVFLDDMPLSELKEKLDIAIRIVHGADDIVSAAIGNEKKKSLSSSLIGSVYE